MTQAALEGVVIPIEGEQLLGGYYRAAGSGPGPAVLLLHGLPGHERNLDLAQELRSCGCHCLYFHFRGSWGSSGSYRMKQLVPDAKAAFEWLGKRQEVDPTRIGLVGISLGGWTPLAAAAELPQVAAVAAISPLVDPAARPLSASEAAEFAASLNGTDAERLQREWLELRGPSHWTSGLDQRPVLLVSADRDEIFSPQHFQPLLGALPQTEWVRFPGADHVFSDVRPGLRHVVRSYLLQVL